MKGNERRRRALKVVDGQEQESVGVREDAGSSFEVGDVSARL